MLGQPMSMLIPQVLGIKLTGELPEGTTATDLVLTIAELLRRSGVVGKFVEFYGPAVARIPLANRATLGNMSPEYGATRAIFPVDDETLNYLHLTGRSEQQVRLVEVYAKEQGLWHDPDHEPAFSQTIELDLASVEPSIAGPKRPQDRIPLASAARTIASLLAVGAPVPAQLSGLDEASAESFPASDPISITTSGPGDQNSGHGWRLGEPNLLSRNSIVSQRIVSQRFSRIPDVASAAAREINAASFGRRSLCAAAYTTRLETLIGR